MYRDATKWLVSLVPVTTLATLGVGLASHLEDIQRDGLLVWVEANGAATAGVALVLVAVVAIVALSCSVLLAKSTDYQVLEADTQWMASAFADGVGRPWFHDLGQFRDAEDRVKTKEGGDEAAQVDMVMQRIRQYSARERGFARFRYFAFTYVASIVLLFGGLGLAITQLPPPAEAIRDTTAVTLVTSEPAVLAAQMGCVYGDDVDVVAVGGTETRPILRVFGDGCTTQDWTPHDELDVEFIFE